MDKEQFIVRTDSGVRIGTSGVIDGKVVLHVKQGKKQNCIFVTLKEVKKMVSVAKEGKRPSFFEKNAGGKYRSGYP